MATGATAGRSRFKVFAVLGVLLGGAALAFIAFRLVTFAVAPSKAGSTDSALIELQRGDGPREITHQLIQLGAISEDRRYEMLWLGRFTHKWSHVKAGEYRVSPAMTPLELFATITSGVSVGHPLTVREGINRYEIADEFNKQKLMTRAKFLALTQDEKFIASLGLSPPPPTLEGYLYPDTYHFTKMQTAEDMIRQMVRKFRSVWGENEERLAKAQGLSRQQVVTLASMIEKETGAPQERLIISSVFHNRLKKGMKLQSDPTTIYGIWERYKGNLRKEDLLTPSPYNTYTVPALPVGPISNPGQESIQAALHPATSEFLYFVSHNDGTHQFSKTFTEHNQAVQRFQVDPSAREGKSWRDLKKNKTTH